MVKEVIPSDSLNIKPFDLCSIQSLSINKEIQTLTTKYDNEDWFSIYNRAYAETLE